MGHGLHRGGPLLPSPTPSKHIFSDKRQRPSVLKQGDFIMLPVLNGPREYCRNLLRKTLPHALRGAVAVVSTQLRHTQHGLGQHSQEAQRLHKQRRVDGQVGDIACHTCEGQDTLHVVCKAAPVPEMVRVKVWGRERERETPQLGEAAEAYGERNTKAWAGQVSVGS